jgi:hypothetical protein
MESMDIAKGFANVAKKATKILNALVGDTFAKGDLFEAYTLKLFLENDFKLPYALGRREELWSISLHI